jgi:hypothetical protein
MDSSSSVSDKRKAGTFQIHLRPDPEGVVMRMTQYGNQIKTINNDLPGLASEPKLKHSTRDDMYISNSGWSYGDTKFKESVSYPSREDILSKKSWI